MTQKTAAELILAARERADMVNSNFVKPATWLSWISDSYLTLYDMLVSAFEDYYILPKDYVPGAVDPITGLPDIDPITGVLILPSDFYKLRSLDALGSSNDENGRPLRPFNWEERNRSSFSNYSYDDTWYPGLRYRIFGSSKIYLLPIGSAQTWLRMWYIPLGTAITDVNTVIDGINGWENFISIDTAIKALMKEETSCNDLKEERAVIAQRIETMAKNRDAGASDRVRDVQRRGRRWGTGFEGEF